MELLDLALHQPSGEEPCRFAALARAARAYTRVDHAFRRLTDPRETATITDIAHASGFEALSTFHRAFHRRFGKAATGVRGRGTAGG